MSNPRVQILGGRSAGLLGPLEGMIAASGQRPSWCFLLAAALLAMQISPWWRPTPDAAAYLSMARSLATTGHMTRFGSRQWYYAPGYPALISPAFLLGDQPFLAISLIHFGLVLALMAGLYLWVRQAAAEAALPVTALVMVNVALWEHYRRTLSELAFMAELAWLAVALSRLRGATFPRQKLAWLATSVLLLAGLCAVRQVGLFIVFGFGIDDGGCYHSPPFVARINSRHRRGGPPRHGAGPRVNPAGASRRPHRRWRRYVHDASSRPAPG